MHLAFSYQLMMPLRLAQISPKARICLMHCIFTINGLIAQLVRAPIHVTDKSLNNADSATKATIIASFSASKMQ